MENIMVAISGTGAIGASALPSSNDAFANALDAVGAQTSTRISQSGPASYPADTAEEAGRIAVEILAGQPPGTFAVILQNTNDGSFVVDGPNSGETDPQAVIDSYPSFFEPAGMVSIPGTPPGLSEV
jgi:hypothetical protein